MSERPKPFIPERANRPEPGFGLALIGVGVMLLIAAILCMLVYALMIAISPLEARKPRSSPPETPVVQPQTPTPAPTETVK